MDCERLRHFPSKAVFNDQSLFRLYDWPDGAWHHSLYRPDSSHRSDAGIFVPVHADLLQNRFGHICFISGSLQYLHSSDNEPPALVRQFVPLVYTVVGRHCDICRRWPSDYIPFAMAVWFATPLIGWQKMSIGKAIFFSFFAVLRTLKAFLVYIFCWLVLGMFMPVIIGSVLILLGFQNVAMFIMVVLSVFLSILAYCSFYPTYKDVFGQPDTDN